MRMSQQKGFPFVHALRGLAALIVAWAHLVYWWPLVHGDEPSQMGQLYSTFLIKPLHLYQEGGHLGVLLFFLISGFVIFHVAQSDGRGAFVVKRAFRILPPLFFSLALMFVVVYLRDHFGWPGVVGNDTNRVQDFLLAATLLGRPLGAPDALSVTWSLFVEIAAYAAVAVVLPLFRGRPIVACAVYAVIANVLLAPSLFFDAWRKSGELFVYMFYIGVGGAIYLGATKRTTLPAALAVAAMYALMFGVWYNVFYPARIWAPPHELWTSYAASLFLFFAGFVSAEALARDRELSRRCELQPLSAAYSRWLCCSRLCNASRLADRRRAAARAWCCASCVVDELPAHRTAQPKVGQMVLGAVAAQCCCH